MSEPRIIPTEEIAEYSLEDIEALQAKFRGCCFWNDSITHIDRECIRLTRDTLDAIDKRLDFFCHESEQQLTKLYNEMAALTVQLARTLTDAQQYAEADEKIRTEFNKLPQLEMADTARAHLTTGHEYLQIQAMLHGVSVKPL
jgi:hypothetical protein